MIPILLSGGAGTRLWPLSRTTYPKQFLTLVGESSLFQDTVKRLPSGLEKPIVVCNVNHCFLATKQLQDIGVDPETMILEPVGRNTAPAIAMVAFYLEAQKRDEIMLILPADHVINNHDAFHNAISVGEEKALAGELVAFGIVPTSAHTGYGYVKAASKEISGAEILEFKEKPDKKTAESYVASGEYYWNSGIFMCSSKIYLSELEKHAPEMYNACKAAFADSHSENKLTLLVEKSFSACASNSIDYAIMEHTERAYVIPMDAGWNDLGAWPSIHEIKDQCDDGNVIEGDIIHFDCSGSYLFSDNKMIAAIGLENMVVIDTLDTILISPKEKVHDVKKIVETLTDRGRPEASLHRLVHRPWGTFDSLDRGKNHQVKKLTIYSSQKLSLQKHSKRAEHWVVVKGVATVTLDGKTFDLKENESIFIPAESVHTIENKTLDTIELIEVQYGSYLGEDDIVRLEDIYGRV